MRQGKRGTIKKAQKKAIKLSYCKAYGYKEEDVWRGPCQSCPIPWIVKITEADPSHKQPAGSGGDKGGNVQPENIIYSCRICHDWVEAGVREGKARRDALIASPANVVNGLKVQWPAELETSLRQFHRTHIDRF